MLRQARPHGKHGAAWQCVRRTRYACRVAAIPDDEDTSPSLGCSVCKARSHVEAAAVRAGVIQVSTHVRYERPLVGPPREHSKAVLTFPHGMVLGEGESREDAIVAALHVAGVDV